MNSSQAGRIWWADVLMNTQSTWVAGEFIRHKAWPADRPGHLDIEVIHQDGTYVTATKGLLRPAQRIAGDSRLLAFRITLPERPPPGSTVRVIHHVEEGAR